MLKTVTPELLNKLLAWKGSDINKSFNIESVHCSDKYLAFIYDSNMCDGILIAEEENVNEDWDAIIRQRAIEKKKALLKELENLEGVS